MIRLVIISEMRCDMARRIIFILTAVLFSSVLCSCNIQQGLVEYPEREEITESVLAKAVENEIERAAKEKHVPPELSDNFVSRYIDIGSFDELKRRTRDGIAAAYNMADMTEGEMALWKELIDKNSVPMFTTDDLQKRAAEINAAIDALAAESNMTMEEYIGQTKYGMTAPDIDAFINKQVEKFKLTESAVDTGNSDGLLNAVPEDSFSGGFGSEQIGNMGTNGTDNTTK